MAIQEINWDVIQGDTWPLDITVKDELGNLIDFYGYTFEMEVRDKEGGKILCATAALGDGITVTGTGTIHIEMTPTKTRKFTFPKAKYQIKSIDSNSRKRTIITGWINVKAGVIE